AASYAAAAGFGFAAGDAVLVADRGAFGSPAFGAPTERGEPDVPRRAPVPGFGRARVAAAAARPEAVGAVAVATGVAGVVGGRSVGPSWCRSLPASPAPADTAARPMPTTAPMMSLGL